MRAYCLATRGQPRRCPQGVHPVQGRTLLRPGLSNGALTGGAQAALRNPRGAGAAAGIVNIANAHATTGRRPAAGGVRRVPDPLASGVCTHTFHAACAEGLRSFGIQQVCPMCRVEPATEPRAAL